jgi:hypothetical protein
VDPLEFALGLCLAVLLAGVAVFFLHRQRQTVHLLRSDAQITLDDRRFLHRQVIRRTFGSLLLLVLAGFLVAWYFVAPDIEALRPEEPGAELSETAKQTLRFITYYWIGTLLVFLVVLVLAVSDLLATARFGARHGRQLEDDRRAALKAEVERLRDRHHLNGGMN